MEVKYYVNEEKRTIVAVLENEKRYLVIGNYGKKSIYFTESEESLLVLDKNYVGKAVCSPEDTWNEELGKRLARRRAYDKYLKNRGRKMLDAVELVDKKMKPIITATAKALSQWENFDVNEI